MRISMVASLWLVLGACGARSGLDISVADPADGGHDAAVEEADLGPDAGNRGWGDLGSDAGLRELPCEEAPHLGPPRDALVAFEARITAADIVFLVDNTASMGAVIDEVERLGSSGRRNGVLLRRA